MSIKNVIASISLSLVVLTSVASTSAVAATITVNSPEECIAIGGKPVGGNSKRCTLNNN